MSNLHRIHRHEGLGLETIIEKDLRKLDEIKEKELELALKNRVLVRDGIWQVPVSERPRGWESMGVREKDAETGEIRPIN